MFKKTFIFTALIMLLIIINVSAEETKSVEIFNIGQEKVEKTIQVNKKIEKIAIDYLNGIDGVYAKFSPIPKSGYAIKIPLSSKVDIKNKWIQVSVNEVIVMFPEDESPFLIIFDSENRLLCFDFHGNTGKLLKLLNLDIKKS